jgi:hypothetical protein
VKAGRSGKAVVVCGDCREPRGCGTLCGSGGRPKGCQVSSLGPAPITVHTPKLPYLLLQAAYMFYTVPGATPLPQLMSDALVLANSTGHDVFNALDILENSKVSEEKKARKAG